MGRVPTCQREKGVSETGSKAKRFRGSIIVDRERHTLYAFLFDGILVHRTTWCISLRCSGRLLSFLSFFCYESPSINLAAGVVH